MLGLLGAMSGADLEPFQFDPARMATGYTLSNNGGTNNKAARSSSAGAQTSVCGLQVLTPGKTIAFTVNAINYAGSSPYIGAGNSSFSVSDYPGSPNSVGLVCGSSAGEMYANNVSIGSIPGFLPGIGDIVRFEVNLTQIRFWLNNDAKSGWFSHGVTGTLYPVFSGFNISDAVTGAWES